ncbi:MAG: FkbM family methyltransferase [Alphaproteobacteria bacterium]
MVYEAFGSDRYSHLAIFELDHKLKKYLDFEGGSFIEAGGNDGLSQSNTYWFESFRGWRGMLVEAVPDQARRCRRNRPRAEVINAALVADGSTKSIRIKAARLMAYIPGARSAEEEAIHLKNAMAVQHMTSVPEIEVPAITLAELLDKRRARLGEKPIDLFSLDVEGYEIPVLKGMNPDTHRPHYILVETKDLDGVLAALKGHYHLVDQLSFHDYLLVTDFPL